MKWAMHVAGLEEKRRVYKGGRKSFKKETNRSSSLDGTITLNWILEAADRIHLDQDRDQWRALVNRAMKFRVLYDVENFLNI
jgi:hypothetical protein